MLTLIAQTLDFYDEAASQGLSGTGAVVATDPEAGFGAFISGILSAVMIVGALLVLVYFIWGAISWITAGGDSGKIQSARDRMTQSAIGLIVLSAVLAIFTVLQQFLGIDVFRFNGSGGGSSSSSSGGTGGCTIGQKVNDGGAGGYCTSGAAIVQCHGPNQFLPYNHYDPCFCVEGTDKQKPGYDFSSCN